MPNRPLLAKLNEDFPKLKTIVDTSITDSLLNYIITLLNIKVENEIQSKDLNIQMLVILDFVKDKFGFLTVEEIREAFKMYVAKELGFKEIYRNLDTIVVSDVLNAYVDFRNESLRVYEMKKQNLLQQDKKITKEESDKMVISGINEIFKEYKNTKTIPIPNFWIFDFLVDKDKIKISNNYANYYEGKRQIAKSILKEEYSAVPTKKSNREDYKKVLQKIEQNDKSIIDLKTKELVIIDYFDKLILENKDLVFE